MSADAVPAPAAPAAPRTRNRRRRRRIIIGGVVLLVVAFIAFSVYAATQSTSTVTAPATSAVQSKTLTVVVSGDGNAVSESSTSVFPLVSGLVSKVEVENGDTVAKGDVLFLIDPASLHAATLQAKSTLATAQQSLASAQQSQASAQQSLLTAQASVLQNQQLLDAAVTSDQKALYRKQLKAAKAGVTSARASVSAAATSIDAAQTSVSSARAAYKAAQKDEGRTDVRAPRAGTVTAVNVTRGQAVQAGSVAATSATTTTSTAPVEIAGTGDLKVEVAINEVDMSGLKTGQDVDLTFDAVPDGEFTGTVSWISPTGTDTAGVVTYDVDVELSEQDPDLKPGMTATADITTRTVEDAVVVPNAAIRVDGLKNYVLVVDAAGAQTRAFVTLGVSDSSYTQITEGVSVGQKVVTSTAEESASTSMFGAPAPGGTASDGLF